MLPPFDGQSFGAGTTVYFEATFTDRFKNPLTPTALTQQLLDITNGKQLLAPTAVTPPPSGNTLEIPIPANLNALTEANSLLQVNRLILTATAPDGSETVQQFKYRLLNPERFPGQIGA